MVLMSYNNEFRGLISKVTKSGNTVYNVAFEDESNNQFTLYLGQDVSKFLDVKKGDKVDLKLDYNFTYKNLNVLEVISNG